MYTSINYMDTTKKVGLMLFLYSIFQRYPIKLSKAFLPLTRSSGRQSQNIHLTFGGWEKEISLLPWIGYPHGVLKVPLFHHQVSCSAIASHFWMMPLWHHNGGVSHHLWRSWWDFRNWWGWGWSVRHLYVCWDTPTLWCHRRMHGKYIWRSPLKHLW